ncbi:hypothetical protein 0305phi8-36p088 [Bacillus phage 0305phi8-36]|uniref:hypothetical protein n=1 Tax=Bacillus phage 0305phi8-36 TaxID=458639 RepID=UPI00015A1FB4|nr:hypothetical protein ST0305phi8-36p088 [Bacillus phage 0305phi8-36]ABS83648.1 hypothetical protein 0305phi8-36p088 [Bacillus phage 0305phi8-36]
MATSITFSVVNKHNEVRFTGEQLTRDESYVAMTALAKALRVQAPYPPELEGALERFFPEHLEEAEDHPENEHYLETGIKYKKFDGEWKETYRLRYNCPTCKHRDNAYILPEWKEKKCHKCGDMMEVRDATSIGFPNQDKHGNFFKAGVVEIDRR